MSVCFYSKDEMANYEGMVLGSKRAIEFFENNAFIKDRIKFVLDYNKETNFETEMKENISRMFWYLLVANRIAYSLQYQENPDFFNEEYSLVKPVYVKNEKIVSKLESIDYNLATNDGNVFIEMKWHVCFLNLIEFLKKYQNEVNEAPKPKIEHRDFAARNFHFSS